MFLLPKNVSTSHPNAMLQILDGFVSIICLSLSLNLLATENWTIKATTTYKETIYLSFLICFLNLQARNTTHNQVAWCVRPVSTGFYERFHAH
jgi:hypothetical protein